MSYRSPTKVEEHAECMSEPSSPGISPQTLSPIDEGKLVLRVDLKVLPILCIVYLVAFIDRYVCLVHILPYMSLILPFVERVNIGNAQLFSLSKDLELNTGQYNIALAVFFVSYIVFEIPANVIMKRVKPHIFSKLISNTPNGA